MTLREAAANSLLMFVAAACVVLIVKTVSPPQGTQHALARSDGAGGVGGGEPEIAVQDGIKVYYLHGNTRCPTCRAIESFRVASGILGRNGCDHLRLFLPGLRARF